MVKNSIYIVHEGLTGGYLPDQSSYFSTKREALSYMRDRANDARNNGYRVSGSASRGYYDLSDPEKSEHAMPEYIEFSQQDSEFFASNIDQPFNSKDELIDYLNSF
jgi:hypothetical protein